jgi:cytosine/adenosine deaminase-related metal-dependent hydrolase
MGLRQAEREVEFRREREREEAEREATMKVMEEAIKAGTASPEVVRAYLEQQTLRKAVEKGAAVEAARAVQERASLEVHKESEEREYERARGLVEAQRQPVVRVQASCPSCGKRLPEGARFCPECGATV